MVSRITAELRELDKRRPAPASAWRLLIELRDALADSGPVELRTTPGCWMVARKTARGALDPLNGDARDGVATRRALLGLRRAFRKAARLERREAQLSSLLARVIPLGLYVLLATLIVVGGATEDSAKDSIWRDPSTGKFDVGKGIVDVVSCTVIFGSLGWLGYATLVRPLMRARRHRALGARLVSGERLLHTLKTREDKLLIATDRRVLLVEPGNKRDGPVTHWSLGYTDINWFADRQDGPRGRRVALRSGSGSFEVGIKGQSPTVAEQVLLVILQHRRLRWGVAGRRSRPHAPRRPDQRDRARRRALARAYGPRCD